LDITTVLMTYRELRMNKNGQINGGQNIQVALTDEGIPIIRWKKTTLTKEELEELRKDDAFAEYMQKCIQEEFERRMRKCLSTPKSNSER